MLSPLCHAQIMLKLCSLKVSCNNCLHHIFPVIVPYTRVNKRIRLFPKLQGNMRLLPNMHLIMKAEIDQTQNRDAFLVARLHERRVES